VPAVRESSSAFPLAKLHAGKTPATRTGDYPDVKVIDAEGREIPLNQGSRIGQEEMKTLMIGVVNRIYPILIRIGAVERLSEDIDLSVSPAFLGINEELVEQADGRNKRTECMKELEEGCIERVRDQFLPELERIANEDLGHRSGGAARMEFQVDTRIKGWGIQEEKFFAPQSILPRFSALARLHQMLHSADSHQPHSVHEPVTSFP